MILDDQHSERLRALAHARKCSEEEALAHAIFLAMRCEEGKGRGEEPVMLCPGGGLRPLPGWAQPNLKRRRIK